MFTLGFMILTSKTRHPETVKVIMAITERYKKSSNPFMQRMFNKLEKDEDTKISKKEKIIKSIYPPVLYVFLIVTHCKFIPSLYNKLSIF